MLNIVHLSISHHLSLLLNWTNQSFKTSNTQSIKQTLNKSVNHPIRQAINREGRSINRSNSQLAWCRGGNKRTHTTQRNHAPLLGGGTLPSSPAVSISSPSSTWLAATNECQASTSDARPRGKAQLRLMGAKCCLPPPLHYPSPK